MEQVCGIYKITNLVNNKCYIGQSVNISSRWKQHTQSLDKVTDPDGENPLRRAFLKYGLLEQVSQPGIYGNFQFEVLLECPKEKLTEEEYAKIAELQPEYNRMMCPPSDDRIWPRKQNSERCCYVQYHNFNALGYLPFEGYTQNEWIDNSGYTVTKKRDALKLKGEKVYLILGIKQKGHKQKDYFLWEYTLVEEVDVIDGNDGPEYGIRGTQYICKKPLRLNDLPGFEHFARNTMGSFAYGFQNVINDPFHEIIENESLFVLPKKSGMSGLEWIANFEDCLDDRNLTLTARDEKNRPHWNFFNRLEEDPSHIWIHSRACMVLDFNPDFFIEQIELFEKQSGKIEHVFMQLCNNVKDLVQEFPDISFKITCPAYHESWDSYVQETALLDNTHLLVQGISLYFPRRVNHSKNFILYFNRNAAEHWPEFELENPPHKGWSRFFVRENQDYIGKRIYFITTLERNGMKKLYLWNYLEVKEIESYGDFNFLWGPVYLSETPVCLNDVLADNEFGLFDDESILRFIKNRASFIPMADVSELEWLCQFEEASSIEEKFRDTTRNKKGIAIFKA